MGSLEAGIGELRLAAGLDPTRMDFRQSLAQAESGLAGR